MDRVTVRVRRLDNNPDLPLPTYQSEGSSGLDLRAAVDDDYPFLSLTVMRPRLGQGAA
jgi:dUTPase